MRHEVLYQSPELEQVGNRIVILTFLSAYGRLSLLYTMRNLAGLLNEHLPEAKALYLEYRDEHGPEKKHLPGYEMRITMVRLEPLKRLCMAVEFDNYGRRVADVDVLIPLEGGYAKVSRSQISRALVPKN